MRNDTMDGNLPPDFIEGIQKNISDVIKAKKKQRKVIGPKVDWPKVKENVDLLRMKCADFSKKVDEMHSVKVRDELAKQAAEIKADWLEIRAMIEGGK
jgi:uncharacterized coiled-coil DUF342 family protein